MAKKKLVQIAKDVDQEEEKKKKAASTSSAAEKAKQTLAQAVKSAIQAEATKQASAPARSVTVPTGNKYTLPSVSTAGPMTAAQQQANGAFNNYFNELLKDFNTYASYGPQQRQELAKGLSSGAIAAPNKGDINNWNDEAALRMSAANAEIIKRLSDAGIFDDPYYALNSNYIGMPTLGYLEGIEEETQKKLEDSLRMDEEDRLYQSNLESTRGAWEQLEAEKNNPYTFDPMYGYAMMEYLQGDRAEPFNYDQWDYEYQMLAPDQRQARLADLEKQWNGLDFDALTGRSYKGYESQTPQLQAQADMLQKEIENRSIIEALESGAMNAADFAEMSKYAGDVLQMGVNDELMYSDPVFFVNNLFTDDFYNATHNSQINWWNRQIEHSESPYLQMGLANAADYEKAVITYYARTGNTEALQQYLNAKSGEWTKRRADTNADFWSTLAQNDKTGWIAWMMARSADVLNYDDKAMQALATLMGNADPNAAYFDEANMKAAIDAANLETLGDIEWLNGFKFGGKNLAQHAYSAGTGAVDSGLSLLLDMLYGGGGKINQALMASQAFSGGLQESAERGLSAAHSFAKSGWDAFVGYMSEKLGVGPEGLTSSSSFRKDFLSEGTEEIVGALGTDIGDELLAQMFGTTSSFEEEVNALALAGSKDPQRDAIYNRLAGYAEAFGYGGIAGGMLGAPGNIATSIDNRATGKALMSEGDAQRLLEIAKTMDANSDVYKIATEIEATTGKGNKMPLGKLGKLTKSLGETLGKQYADITDGVMDDAIRNRLLELGSTPDAAKRNASIIRKIVNGVKLTVTERASAMWDQFAEQVTKEISRQMNATQQNNAAVPGAAAPEGQRTGQNVSTTVQEAVKNSAGKVRKGANGKAAGNLNSARIAYDDGSVSGEGDIRRFEESEDGKLLMVIEGKDGEAKVDIGSYTQADGEGTAGLLESIKDINDNLHKVSAEEASAMLSSYKAAGGDVARFVEGYETLYLRGYSGGTDLAESLPKTDLDGTLANIAVEAGKRQAEADETARKQRASAYKAVEAPTSGWLGKVTSDAQVRGSGDAESLTGALDAMTESQRMTAETAIELGKAIGVNVVLYESDSKNMGRIANGSFDQSTHTVYLDINAGLGSAQDIQAQKDNGTLGYAIMRTMGHELTHYLEAASPEMYAKYKTAVTNALKDAGQDMAVLIREKIDRALSQGKKLSYNGAVAEVIADASEYMLQDSKFTTRLDNTLRGKVKNFVQNFMGKVKEIFSKLTSAHKESEALREMVDGVYRYTGQLQELWDASLQEVMDKGTADPSGDTTEMVEGQNVKYSPRDMANEDVTEMTLEDGKNNLKYVKQLFVKNDRSENHMYIPIAGSLNKGFLELVKQPDLPVVMQVAKGMQAMAPEMARINGGHGHNLTPAEIMSAIGQLNGETAAFYNDKKSRWAAVSESNTGKTIILFFDFGQHINPEYLYGIKTTGDHVLVTAFTREDADNAYDYLGKGGYTKTPDAEVAGARISPSHANRVPDNSVPQPGENVNPDVQNSLRDLPTDITVRDYLRELKPTDRMNETEKILLKRYQDTLSKLQEAEKNATEQNEILKTATGDELIKAKNRWQIYRKQADRYARELARAERAEGFAGMLATGQKLVDQYLTGGYTRIADASDELEAEIKGIEKKLKVIGATLQGAEQGQKNAHARGLFNQSELNVAKDLAQDILTSSKYKRGIAPFVKMAEGASDLSSYVSNAEAYGGQIANAAAKAVEGAIQSAKTATKKASSLWHRAVKEVQLSEDVIDYYRALDEQRRLMELAEQKKALSEQLKTDAAKKIHEQVEKQRTEYREREQKAREYRKTRDEVDKLRRGIGRKVKRLNTLRMRETDQKHVPQELQHVADLVMQTFTDSSLGRLAFHEAKLLNLGRSYRLLLQSESDATYYWDDEIETDITNLQALSEAYTAMQERGSEYPSRVSLEGVELETEILQGVDAIVSNVLNMIDSTNTAFPYKRNETFEQFAKKTGEKLLGHKDHKVLKGIPGKIQEMLDETVRTGNMTPIYFFEHLQNQELLDVFNELRDGQNLYAQIVAEGKDFVQTAKNRHNYGAWVNDGRLKMKTGQGHTIELTREEAAEIYAIAKREQANKLYQTEHLLYGGFQYKNIQDKVSEDGKTQLKNNPHQLDKADIARIGEWLTAEQKAYADELVGFLSTTMADYGNQASMDMYGYKKFTESYYIPFHTVAEQRFLKGDEGPQGENAGTGRVKNSGFTHKVQHKANQTLYVGGLTDTVADHIHKMAAYSAMVQPIENMKRLMNHKVLENDGTVNTVRALIGQKYGKASQDYLTQLLKDANGATMSDQRAAALTDKLVGAFKRGAVMASASVVLQQPTAAARAMAYISPKYFAQNPFYRPGKGTWDEMMKYSGTAVIKDMGKFDVGMGLTATQYISDENLNVFEAYRRLKGESKTKAGKAAYDRFMAWMTAAPGKADQWTWGLIWKAVKAEQAALHPEMNQQSEAFLNMCGARFDDVIDHTQVYDSVLTRSNLMRSTNALHKMATSFMSEPTLSLNMLYDALTGKHTGKERAGIIGGVVASQVLAGALAALVQAWNDDDDERNWLEKYADRATGNIIDNIFVLNMIPYVSDIVSLFQGYDVERPDMSVIADIYDYSKTFFKAFEDGGTPSWKQIENFAGTLANLVGVPAKNISREIRRTRNAIFNTDWSAPDAFGVGQAMLGNVAGYGVNNKDYYKRIVTALVRGDTETAEDYKTFMLASKAVEADTLTKGLRDAYKERYEKGGIDKDQAISFLMDNNLVTGETEDERKKSAFQYVDKWEEGTDSYSAYNTLKEAYAAINFSEIEKAWKELTNNGYTDKQVKEQSRTLLKKLVQEGSITTGQATQLLKKWCPYAKDSDNTDKPREWANSK